MKNLQEIFSKKIVDNVAIGVLDKIEYFLNKRPQIQDQGGGGSVSSKSLLQTYKIRRDSKYFKGNVCGLDELIIVLEKANKNLSIYYFIFDGGLCFVFLGTDENDFYGAVLVTTK